MKHAEKARSVGKEAASGKETKDGTPLVGYTAGTPPRGKGGTEGRTLAIRALRTRGLI